MPCNVHGKVDVQGVCHLSSALHCSRTEWLQPPNALLHVSPVAILGAHLEVAPLGETPLYQFFQNFTQLSTGQAAAMQLLKELFTYNCSLQPLLAREQEVFLLMDCFFLKQVRKDTMALSLTNMQHSVNKLADSIRKMVAISDLHNVAKGSLGYEYAAVQAAQVEEAAKLRHKLLIAFDTLQS